jgi:adenylate kinase family enzyme
MDPGFQRIIVIGTSGSGKTTLARQISQALSPAYPHIELDALHWEPNWTEAPDERFRQRAREACAAPRWVMDGNYSVVRDITWPRADTIIWLNYPRRTTWSRILTRTLTRTITREELWSGNRESVRTSFLSRDSIILWSIQTWAKNRARTPLLLAQPQHAHLHTIELRHPGQAQTLVAALARHLKPPST